MLGDPKVYRRVIASLITLGVSVLTFDPDPTYKGIIWFAVIVFAWCLVLSAEGY